MDMELVYNFLGMSGIYEKVLANKSSDILASSIESAKKVAQKGIERLIKKYQ